MCYYTHGPAFTKRPGCFLANMHGQCACVRASTGTTLQVRMDRMVAAAAAARRHARPVAHTRICGSSYIQPRANSVAAPEKSLALEVIWACTSRPITTSHSPVSPWTRYVDSVIFVYRLRPALNFFRCKMFSNICISVQPEIVIVFLRTNHISGPSIFQILAPRPFAGCPSIC